MQSTLSFETKFFEQLHKLKIILETALLCKQMENEYGVSNEEDFKTALVVNQGPRGIV
jgi:L-arabinose isomerase